MEANDFTIIEDDLQGRLFAEVPFNFGDDEEEEEEEGYASDEIGDHAGGKWD